MEKIRHNWEFCELQALYDLPLLELISKAHAMHILFHDVQEIQVCKLISIKTGGCPEDCKYCAQSSRYQTAVSAQPLMNYAEVLEIAKQAKEAGASRICLGAAWREVRESKQFDAILEMVQGITALQLEVCCTLGMLKEEQAERLKKAGLYAYNHNLDSSEKFYKTIITTRTYQERLQTLDIVEKTGISVCCGGIVGMGETPQDRLELIHNLCRRNPHPESVPINRLARVPGTPLENEAAISIWEVVRLIAVARLVLPRSIIRLSCGRMELSYEQHALCFFAGANSIFTGERLLTVANTSVDKDEEMFELFSLKKREAFIKSEARCTS